MDLDVGGLTIAYEIQGNGPLVVLAHGFVGDGPSTWSGQMESLADDFTVVAWDAPGAGRSADPPAGFGMAGYADTFAAVVRAVGTAPAHLVGLSFGAALVLASYHRHPGLARSLTLVSGYAGWYGSLGAEVADERLALSLSISDRPREEFVSTLAPSMFSPSAHGDRVARFVDNVRDSRPHGFREMARASYEDQTHVLPEVDVPTLLLYSDDDVRAPVAVGEAMHEAIRGSQLVVLQGPGHASPVEAPDEVTHELRRFLAGLEL